MKLLATHSTRSISYYICLFMQAQFQLGSYIHACTNEITEFYDLIRTLAVIIIGNTNGPLNLVNLLEK